VSFIFPFRSVVFQRNDPDSAASYRKRIRHVGGFPWIIVGRVSLYEVALAKSTFSGKYVKELKVEHVVGEEEAHS
jgi:hypothetical protein